MSDKTVLTNRNKRTDKGMRLYSSACAYAYIGLNLDERPYEYVISQLTAVYIAGFYYRYPCTRANVTDCNSFLTQIAQNSLLLIMAQSSTVRPKA